MLISPRRLLLRARHPASRVDELESLRARFAVQPSRRGATAEQRRLAERLRALREAMIDALGEVEACRGCAKGHPLPAGRWQGGHCCGGRTLHIWSADEVAALRLGGTRFADLDPPRSDHAGCIYRGPLGCSLAPQDRPTICVRFLCLELRGELREDPRWREVSRLGAELRDTFAALMELLGREPRTKGPVAADGAPLSALLPRHVSPR